MAVDAAILDAVIMGKAPWTIRFYQWLSPSLTVGYFQKSSDIDQEACSRMGIPIIRRLTGGRAVFHDREITCSVVMTVPPGSPGSVRETFKSINQALLDGLASFGIEGMFVKPQRGGEKKSSSSPICFNAPSQYEVLLEGKKVLGSAQTRRSGVLLQQGSLPLTMDRNTMAKCFGRRPGGADDIKGLLEFIDRNIDEQALINACIAGFERSFCGSLAEGALHGSEAQEACYLEETKYGSREWNHRR
jgi:lipoate-protein ligase A